MVTVTNMKILHLVPCWPPILEQFPFQVQKADAALKPPGENRSLMQGESKEEWLVHGKGPGLN
jgi:hypothetical protein